MTQEFQHVHPITEHSFQGIGSPLAEAVSPMCPVRHPCVRPPEVNRFSGPLIN